MKTDFNMAEVLRDAVTKAIRDRGHVNILIAGKTGVGKSTLINAVFQGNLAVTGQGRPVTPNTREITKEGIPLTIFDSRGLEVANYAETLGELERFISQRSGEADPQRHIHVGWVCIAEDIRRVEPAEVQLVDLLRKHFPVVVVITKARADGGFRAEVQSLLPHAKNVVRVRALSEELDDGHRLDAAGLKELVDLTMEVVPEGHRNALVAVQKVDLQQKMNRSHVIVATASATAAAAGASPIPFSDAIALVPTQVGMLAAISATFGLPLSSAFLGTLISGAIASGGGTIGGRMLAGWLLKLIPGVGTVVGGLITGSVAAALTASFGEAYIAALYNLMKQNPDAAISPEQVAAAFKKELSSKTEAPA